MNLRGRRPLLSKRQALCNLFVQVKGGKFTRVDPVGKGFVCEGSIFTRR